MKKLTLLAVFVFGILWQVQAQQRTVERSFTVSQDEPLELDLDFGNTITVNAWDKNRVEFVAVIEINSGRLNDALELDFKQDNGLRIASDYNEDKLKAGRRFDCPDSYSRNSWNSDNDDHYVVCSNISYELRVPRDVDLDVESISADINLVGLAGPIRAKSISGYVDLSWSSGKPADIDIKTVSGEAFTNLDDLHFDNKKPHIPIVGYKLKGRIGSGGPAVSLESVSGNVYLRKANT